MSKAKASFKGIIFFLIIGALIAGVVLLIVYWPQRPGELKNAVQDQNTVVFSSDSDFVKNMNLFDEYTDSIRRNNEDAPFTYSYGAVRNICNSLDVYFEFMSYSCTNADFSTFDKGQFAAAKKGLATAKDKMISIGKFLGEKNETLTKDGFNTKYYDKADAELVWANIEGDFKVVFENYSVATEALAKVYSENINKGIYANDFAYLVVSGVSDYLYFFANNTDKLGTYDGHLMSYYMLTFTNNYLSSYGRQRLVAQYLTSANLQTNTEKLMNFERLTGLTSLRSVCQAQFAVDTTKMTEGQIEIVNIAKAFYKGGFTA